MSAPPQPPLVTIVTAVRNGLPYLPDNLASVRGQDHPRIEHVVVDGGSTDGTLDVLKEATGVTWVTGRDRGMYDAINRGLALAKGEIVAYQNADDRYVVPDAVSAAAAVFAAEPEVDVVYGDYRLIDWEGKPIRPRHIVLSPEFDVEALRRFNFVPPHSTFVRRRVLDDPGLWLDPELGFAGDWEWFLRLARAGKRFLHLRRVLSEFRIHRRSKTRTVGWRAKIDEWKRICERHQASLPVLLWYEILYIPARRRLGLDPWPVRARPQAGLRTPSTRV